jgi:hypothetical protein
VEVPALDAELSLIDGMGFQRQGADQISICNLKKHAAACAAVRTDGWNEL